MALPHPQITFVLVPHIMHLRFLVSSCCSMCPWNTVGMRLCFSVASPVATLSCKSRVLATASSSLS
jgi:hypothetical protein